MKIKKVYNPYPPHSYNLIVQIIGFAAHRSCYTFFSTLANLKSHIDIDTLLEENTIILF